MIKYFLTYYIYFFCRLIVIADKINVYKTFPIPLINRLEKHVLTIVNGMSPFQVEAAEKLKTWVFQFSCLKSSA